MDHFVSCQKMRYPAMDMKCVGHLDFIRCDDVPVTKSTNVCSDVYLDKGVAEMHCGWRVDVFLNDHAGSTKVGDPYFRPLTLWERMVAWFKD
jgi:hypothetical protein